MKSIGSVAFALGVLACVEAQGAFAPSYEASSVDAPSPSPTFEPTGAGTVVSASCRAGMNGAQHTNTCVHQVAWSTTISMTGITASAVTDSDEDAILEGIAACSDDISSGHLEISSITDLSSRRRRALLEDSTGIDIEYTTEVTLEQTAYTNAHSLFKVRWHISYGILVMAY